jgi:hypothetical protein
MRIERSRLCRALPSTNSRGATVGQSKYRSLDRTGRGSPDHPPQTEPSRPPESRPRPRHMQATRSQFAEGKEGLLLQQCLHGPSVRVAADFWPEFKRRRPENCFALRADAAPVKGELEACVSDVERLAGADHGDAAGGAIAEGSQDVESHVGNLDALNPGRPLGHECIVEGSQRVELLPFLNRRGGDRHQVEVVPG